MTARTALVFALLSVGQTCHWNEKCPYSYFGSKTVYDDVRGDIRDVPELKGCKPTSVWALMRHGIRRPSNHNVPNMLNALKLQDDIIRSHREGRGELCAQDISNLQSWAGHGDINYETAGHLTPEGYQEMNNLGARFHERFLPLLKKLDRYHFKPTLEQRTIESGKAFVEGLGQDDFKFEMSNATDVDEVLRPYYYCAKHNVEVYCGPRSKKEMGIYQKTKEYQTLMANVQKRSGLDVPLSPANISGLYDLCRYYRAYGLRTSPWCALFSNQELVVMEYFNDLRHYYVNGYGFPINFKLGRTALKDLFENFRSIVEGSTNSFTGYFSHDSMLQMIYTALGLFRDNPEVFGFERIPGRKWRTSFITPFAANFVAVLHKCNTDSSISDYQVQFLINEKEIHLCPARTCSWAEFVEKFQPYLNSSLDFCKMENTTAPSLETVNVTQS